MLKGNQMTNVDFLTRKNKIFFDLTGEILVPPQQIVELDVLPRLSQDTFTGDSETCTYCVYYKGVCSDCPMGKAGNACNIDIGNTYRNVKSKLHNLFTLYTEFKDLVHQYNSELPK